MNAVQVMQAGAGEAMEMQQEVSEAMAMRQGVRGAAKARIRARITHVGSEYRKAVTSGTCEGRVQLSVYPSFCLKGLMHDE